MENIKYVASLPDGYDGRTKIALTEQGLLVIAHPNQPVRYFEGKFWLRPLNAPAYEEFEAAEWRIIDQRIVDIIKA